MALTKITPQMFDTSAAGHDFNIDNGTFVVDASANRVGIGTTTPSTLLDVNGVLTATSIAGTLTTAAQTNITSVGTLSSLTVSGALNGTLSTAAQTNITSLGTLTALTVDDITIDGSTISDAGDFTIDIGGNISLDADDGGHVRFKDGGTQYASIYKSGSGAIIDTPSGGDITLDSANDIILDAAGNDIIFKDAGTTFGQITNDTGNMIIYNSGSQMLKGLSSGSNAQFMGNVGIGNGNPAAGKLVITDSSNGGFGGTLILENSNASDTDKVAIALRPNGSATTALGSYGELRIIGEYDSGSTNGASNLQFHTHSGNGTVTERMRISSDGKVGIGTTTLNKVFNMVDPAQGGETVKLHFEANSSTDLWNIYSYDRSNSHYTNMLLGQYLYLKQGGDVGVGTTSPDVGSGWNRVLHLHSLSSGSHMRFTDSNTGATGDSGLFVGQYHNGSYFINRENGAMLFYTNNLERIRILAGGDVGIGATSAGARLEVRDNSSNNYSTSIRLSQGYNSVYSQISSNFGGDMTLNAGVNGAPNSKMNFSVNGTVRARILNGGQFIVGSNTTSHTDETKVLLSPAGGQLNVYNMAATNEWWIMNNLANQSGYTTKIDFRVQNSSKGYIGITGSTVIYYSNSDYRLKENYNYNFDATSLVKAMKPLEFTWKDEPMVGKQMGFLAHELKEVTPYVVQGDKDEVRDDGEIRPQVVDQGKLVAVLTKALQEALVRIETLETEVKALKGE